MWNLRVQHKVDTAISSQGYEAVHVGSAACIEVGKDFTLPYYRDLGVVLTIGMTPYEVFRSYLQSIHQDQTTEHGGRPHAKSQPLPHNWNYQKHNTVTGSTSVATQLLHGAGIAFASKLRKAAVVTVAYCDDEAITEADSLEAFRFAAQHQLPIVFVCEQDHPATPGSRLQHIPLPVGLHYSSVHGIDVLAVHTAMHTAMNRARSDQGPTLLAMDITPALAHPPKILPTLFEDLSLRLEDILQPDVSCDPLQRCQQYMQAQGLWDAQWAQKNIQRTTQDIKRALQDALQDL